MYSPEPIVNKNRRKKEIPFSLSLFNLVQQCFEHSRKSKNSQYSQNILVPFLPLREFLVEFSYSTWFNQKVLLLPKELVEANRESKSIKIREDFKKLKRTIVMMFESSNIKKEICFSLSSTSLFLVPFDIHENRKILNIFVSFRPLREFEILKIGANFKFFVEFSRA